MFVLLRKLVFKHIDKPEFKKKKKIGNILQVKACEDQVTHANIKENFIGNQLV